MVIKIMLSKKDHELIDNYIDIIKNNVNDSDIGVMEDNNGDIIIWCETSFIMRMKKCFNNLNFIDKMKLLSVKDILKKFLK